MGGLSILKWLEGFLPPVTFLAILWVLLEAKGSRQSARWALAGFLAAEAVLQGGIYNLSFTPELVLTLLPLTFYLPAILGAHLLSKYPFLPTAVAWLFALLCQDLLLTERELLSTLGSQLRGFVWSWVRGGLLLLSAVGMIAALFLLFRKPFRAAAGELSGGWASLPFLPIMLLALYSYLLSSPGNAVMLFLLFLTALAAVLVTARMISSLNAQRQARDSQLQVEALRQDYALLQKKLELGRRYRHDVRHHMLALSALIQQEKGDEALDYVSRWQGQMTQLEQHSWCRSPVINAVISAYQAQAQEAGCVLDAEVSLPQELPFEETDLCVALANALENAVHACQAMPEGKPRRIRLELILTDRRRLTLHVENSCPAPVEFDRDGFPITPPREGHGQGLRSIASVAEKYHGIFHCGYADGVFDLRVALLDASPEPRPVRRIPAVYAGILLGIFLLNCMPSLARALEIVPILGPVIQVVDLRSYSWFWGATGISVDEPVLDGEQQAVNAILARQGALIQQMKDLFLDYAARKYHGYVAEDITHQIILDDGRLFILRLDATLNAGGSVDYHRYIVLDKETARVLSLGDLFQSGVDYLSPINQEITAQMQEQIDAGTGDYFLPGGIWAESECFQSIAEDQNFYVDETGRLVIVFDEYEVAPGSMGSPEFTIPTHALNSLLAQPSVLR